MYMSGLKLPVQIMNDVLRDDLAWLEWKKILENANAKPVLSLQK